jgi:hypothetical protein
MCQGRELHPGSLYRLLCTTDSDHLRAQLCDPDVREALQALSVRSGWHLRRGIHVPAEDVSRVPRAPVRLHVDQVEAASLVEFLEVVEGRMQSCVHHVQKEDHGVCWRAGLDKPTLDASLVIAEQAKNRQCNPMLPILTTEAQFEQGR